MHINTRIGEESTGIKNQKPVRESVLRGCTRIPEESPVQPALEAADPNAEGLLTPKKGEEQNPAIAGVLGTRAINAARERRKRERDLALD